MDRFRGRELMAEKKRTIERMAPPIEVALLDEIRIGIDGLIKQTESLLSLQKAQIPEGIALDWEGTARVGEPWYLNFLEDRPYTRLFRVELINKGPDDATALIKIRDQAPYEITVEADETIPIEWKVAKLEELEFRVKAGSATVKVIGLY